VSEREIEAVCGRSTKIHCKASPPEKKIRWGDGIRLDGHDWIFLPAGQFAEHNIDASFLAVPLI
jgi:hypothetical protein